MSKKNPKIYLIHCKNINLYKIGISVNPEKRIKQLQTGTPYELSIISIYNSKYPFKVEKILHNTFVSKKTPDNFQYDFELLSGEWFNLTAEDVINFSDSCKKIEDTIEKLKIAENPFI
jgi:hypothetical protein